MTTTPGRTASHVDAKAPPAPEPELPAAFAKDGDPYSLDDLLSGLPPVAETDALLLSELAPADTAPAPVWTDGDSAGDAVAESPTEELQEADSSAAMTAMVEVAVSADAETDNGAAAAEAEEVAAPPPAPLARQRDPDEWDPSALSMGNIVAALSALADDSPPAPEPGAMDAPLDATPAFAATAEAEPQEKAEPVEEAPAAIDISADLAARVEAIIAAFVPAGMWPAVKGDSTLPERLDALALLLADPPPADDFAALDALYACWPRSTHDSDSRALLAVAHNLSRYFGLPGKLPMAATRAWRMLSPTVFETELAQRLSDIDTFIAEWQGTQRVFLILEYGEIELIESLFEALHPGYHAELLAKVMNFKVLSNRRLGLIRRIPTRIKKQITAMLPAGKDQAMVELAHAKALLEQLAGHGFAPLANAAAKALEEVEKMMKAVANIGAPPPPAAPPGGGLPLGRIG